MSATSLEDRVARLEEQMDRLAEISRQGPEQPGRDEWLDSVGMFRGDPVFKEMIDESVRTRAEERQRAREAEERCQA